MKKPRFRRSPPDEAPPPLRCAELRSATAALESNSSSVPSGKGLAAAQLTFVKLRLLSNLVCSFRNSEVLTGESPDMLRRSMLYPWHLF